MTLPAILSLRRPATAVALVLSLFVLAAALFGASQTFAQTHRAACSASRARTAKTRRSAAACTTRKRKHRRKRHRAGKHHRRHTKGAATGGASGSQPTSARCEDGSTPTASGEGSFTCENGSQPECEDGATPRPSGNGKTLICPAVKAHEAGEVEAECEDNEEEERLCGEESSTQPCEAGTACEAQS